MISEQPPEVTKRIVRRWNLINDLRPAGRPWQLQIPYGTDTQITLARERIFVRLEGMDEVRESAGALATVILIATQEGRITPDDLRVVMGADQTHWAAGCMTPPERQQVA